MFTTTEQGPTLIVTINRPHCYNALDRESKIELAKFFQSLKDRRDIRSVILTGEGKAFCTGQDLNDRTINAASSRPADLATTLKEEWIPLVESIRQAPQLVIGAINGVAAGAGVSVALACDLIVMDEKARFVSGFAKIGLVPDAGSTFTFTRSLGSKKALEFFLFNEPLGAEELLKAGLINQISADALHSAKEMSQKINGLAPLSAEMIKKNVQSAEDLSYNECLEREVQAQGKLGASQDYQEGLKAFFEKRTAQFQGR